MALKAEVFPMSPMCQRVNPGGNGPFTRGRVGLTHLARDIGSRIFRRSPYDFGLCRMGGLDRMGPADGISKRRPAPDDSDSVRVCLGALGGWLSLMGCGLAALGNLGDEPRSSPEGCRREEGACRNPAAP